MNSPCARKTRARLAVTGTVLLIGAGLAAGAEATSSARGPVVARGQIAAGHGLGYWLGSWWKWRLRFKDRRLAPYGKCVTRGQHGPAWFLLGEVRKSNQYRSEVSCSIPAHRYLAFPVQFSVDCSTVERRPYHASTDRGLLRCARRDWRRIHERFNPHEVLKLDGHRISHGYLVASPVLRFTMPAHDNHLHVRGGTHGRFAVFGTAFVLRPLSPGRHTLWSRTKDPGYPPMINTLRLNVRR
jgi:hypothetical protein